MNNVFIADTEITGGLLHLLSYSLVALLSIGLLQHSSYQTRHARTHTVALPGQTEHASTHTNVPRPCLHTISCFPYKAALCGSFHVVSLRSPPSVIHGSRISLASRIL